MSEGPEVRLTQQTGYRFDIDFGGGRPHLQSDEPPPLGGGEGPEPVRLLLAAVAACMSSSFYFAMQKFHESPGAISTTARATIGRDEAHRLRIQSMELAIGFAAPAESIGHLTRILEQFEQFCTVSASVRRGIPMTVSVTDGAGKRVK
jgi:uncharacterized OsmC-like protein